MAIFNGAGENEDIGRPHLLVEKIDKAVLFPIDADIIIGALKASKAATLDIEII